MPVSPLPYCDFATWLRSRFGCRVQKITLDAGLGCPNRDGAISVGGCIYCNSRGSGTGAHACGASLSAQIAAARRALQRRYRAQLFLAYFQSYCNTYAPVARLRQLYDEALAPSDVVGLCVGTRPDCAGDDVLDLLAGYARHTMVWIEYGLQSAHDETLRRINRGHDFACFRDAVARTAGRGINVCAHLILGLPGETPAMMRATARQVAALEIAAVKIHLLYVVRGTELEHQYRCGAYRCLEQEEYVRLVCDVLERLPASVVVQRLTGDPHPDELVAPQWSRDKRSTRALILDEMRCRGTVQGSRCR